MFQIWPGKKLKKTTENKKDNPSGNEKYVESSKELGGLDWTLQGIDTSKEKSCVDDMDDEANKMEKDEDSPCLHVRQGVRGAGKALLAHLWNTTGR